MNVDEIKGPLVSVLVPCFNHSKYVLLCLESIKSQNYKNIELLVIDDGSTDDSFEKIESWCGENSQSFVRIVWEKSENRGITKTLGTLFRLARGEFIAFCASDDLLTESSISLRVQKLTASPSMGAVFGRCELIDPFGKLISSDAARALYGAKPERYRHSCVKDELFYKWSMVGPATLYRRSVLEKIGGIDENYMVEDRSLFMRLILKSDLVHIGTSVAQYRFHTGSVTRAPTTRPAILIDIAKLHVQMQHEYVGLKRLFLLSYVVDLRILPNLDKKYYEIIYLAWKAHRKIWSSLMMVGISLLRS